MPQTGSAWHSQRVMTGPSKSTPFIWAVEVPDTSLKAFSCCFMQRVYGLTWWRTRALGAPHPWAHCIVCAVTGGEPVRRTWDGEEAIPVGWAPDGSR